MSVAVASVKKFINEPADVVKESLTGLGLAHADLVRIDAENQLVLRKDAPLQSEINSALPSFPPGTEVALLRQMTMFDNTGNLIPGPITESVQLRVYRDVSGPPPDQPGSLRFAAAGSGQKKCPLASTVAADPRS